jgi:hypothetical protein
MKNALPGFVYRPTGSVTEDTLYRRRRVTDSYPWGDPLQAPAIVLVVRENSIVGVGMLERGAKMTTFERRISVGDLELISQPLDIGWLLTRVASRVRRHARETFRVGGPVPPATWLEVRAVLDAVPDLRALIARLDHRAVPPPWVHETDRRARQVLEQEQDAVGLALSLGGLERGALASWAPAEEPLPFLAGLEHVELREDQLLFQDTLVFGDWDRRNVNGLWAEFWSPEGRRVTVMNVNRHPLETTLGVDLIYYSHPHDAFTLVQYKRMRWERRTSRVGRDPVYRPAHDRNLARQITRMRRVEKGGGVDPVGRMVDYRLGRSTCFLKVCRPDLDLGASELSRGMYMDLDLWALVLAYLSETETNPAISFDRGTRYLTNTEFIDLVRKGWIGSRDVTSAKIMRYVDAELRGRHSVTLATATA